MTKSLNLANAVMAQIVANVPATTLSRTTYAAAVVKLANGTRAVVIGEAGASASGINGRLLSLIENTVQVPVLGVATPIQGQGTWHMNDAEQQVLRMLDIVNGVSQEFHGARLKAIVANRAVCQSCTYTLQQLGLVVNGNHAVAP